MEKPKEFLIGWLKTYTGLNTQTIFDLAKELDNRYAQTFQLQKTDVNTSVYEHYDSKHNKETECQFDGSVGCQYTDNPRLKKQDDLYYTGCGCTWGVDLDGKKYWKRYSSFITDGGGRFSRYSHLSHGDIIDEKARIKKLVQECLFETGLLPCT